MRESGHNSVPDTSTRAGKDQSHLEATLEARAAPAPRFIFIGGQSHTTGEPCSLVDTYDVTGGNPNDVMKIPPLPGKRLDASLVAKDGVFYVIGGFDGVKSCDTVLKFTPNDMRWTELHRMNFGRHGHTSSIVGDHVIIAGGVRNDMKRTSSVEAYDIINDKWITLPELPHGALSSAASCDHNGDFIVSGGIGGTNAPTTMVFCFNMASKRWRRMPDLQCRRSQHAMASVSGTLYVLGDVTNKTVECYDLNSNSFVINGELPVAKCGSTASVVKDSIILAGGWNRNDPIVTYNVGSHVTTTDHVTRNCLSPHVALYQPEVLSLWVLSRTFIRNHLREQDNIKDLPLPRVIKEAI